MTQKLNFQKLIKHHNQTSEGHFNYLYFHFAIKVIIDYIIILSPVA